MALSPAGLAIVDTMNFIKSDQTIVGHGGLSSLQAVRRASAVLPNAGMIHQPMGGTGGGNKPIWRLQQERAQSLQSWKILAEKFRSIH